MTGARERRGIHVTGRLSHAEIGDVLELYPGWPCTVVEKSPSLVNLHEAWLVVEVPTMQMERGGSMTEDGRSYPCVSLSFDQPPTGTVHEFIDADTGEPTPFDPVRLAPGPSAVIGGDAGRWYVGADGCDADTPAVIDLTDDEVATVRKVALALNAASYYGCMPTLEVRPATDRDVERYAEALRDAADRENE